MGKTRQAKHIPHRAQSARPDRITADIRQEAPIQGMRKTGSNEVFLDGDSEILCKFPSDSVLYFKHL